jgi:molybdopterin synthase sulfur carrier subunit
MIRLRLFASIKEVTNIDEESFPFDGVKTVLDLKKLLSLRGKSWKLIFDGDMIIKAAVNKELVSDDFHIQDGDEVAFFPPVTGG